MFPVETQFRTNRVRLAKAKILSKKLSLPIEEIFKRWKNGLGYSAEKGRWYEKKKK